MAKSTGYEVKGHYAYQRGWSLAMRGYNYEESVDSYRTAGAQDYWIAWFTFGWDDAEESLSKRETQF